MAFLGSSLANFFGIESRLLVTMLRRVETAVANEQFSVLIFFQSCIHCRLRAFRVGGADGNCCSCNGRTIRSGNIDLDAMGVYRHAGFTDRLRAVEWKLLLSSWSGWIPLVVFSSGGDLKRRAEYSEPSTEELNQRLDWSERSGG